MLRKPDPTWTASYEFDRLPHQLQTSCHLLFQAEAQDRLQRNPRERILFCLYVVARRPGLKETKVERIWRNTVINSCCRATKIKNTKGEIIICYFKITDLITIRFSIKIEIYFSQIFALQYYIYLFILIDDEIFWLDPLFERLVYIK